MWVNCVSLSVFNSEDLGWFTVVGCPAVCGGSIRVSSRNLKHVLTLLNREDQFLSQWGHIATSVQPPPGVGVEVC